MSELINGKRPEQIRDALPCAVDVLRRIAKAMEDTDGSQTD